jgi:hypothetical protein
MYVYEVANKILFKSTIFQEGDCSFSLSSVCNLRLFRWEAGTDEF